MLQRIQLRNGEWVDFKSAVPQLVRLPYAGTIREDKYKASDYWSSKMSGWGSIPIKAFTTYRSKQLGGGVVTIEAVEDDAFILLAKLADPFCNFEQRCRAMSTEPSPEIAAAIGQRVFFNDSTQQKETSDPRIPVILRPALKHADGTSTPRRATLRIRTGQPTPPTPPRRPVTVKPAVPTPMELPPSQVEVDDLVPPTFEHYKDSKRVQSALDNIEKAKERLQKALKAAADNELKKIAKKKEISEDRINQYKVKCGQAFNKAIDDLLASHGTSLEELRAERQADTTPAPEPIKDSEALSREEVIRNCKSLGMSEDEIQAFMGEK